jgi:quercetin dioxygenase-like cupin family protein
MDSSSAIPVHRSAAEGEAFWAMGSLFEMKLRGEDTAGELGIMVVTQPPGVATPLHSHGKESEVFYVLDGTLTYEAGGTVHELEKGSTMWLPQGVPHRFRITGDQPARVLALVVPAGLEDLYASVGRVAEELRVPDAYPPDEELARWRELGPRMGLQVMGPPLPE